MKENKGPMDKDPKDYLFSKGNKFYRIRNTHGRDTKYTPGKLLKKANEYFDWCDANPLNEEKAFHYQGAVITHNISKMRAYTLEGLCNFAGIVIKTFWNYSQPPADDLKDDKKIKKQKDFQQVTLRIRQVIDSQQFEGAAADLLNHNIIAQKLGLKSKVEHSGDAEHPIAMSHQSITINERGS